MWTILKYNKNNLNLLKRELQKKTDKDLEIYIPKINLQIYKKKKAFFKEVNIMGDYLFCYHKKFQDKNFYNVIRYTKGLKYILEGYENAQKEIKNFIFNCKNSENDKGFISKNFYELVINSNYRFNSGPFINNIFKLIDFQKNSINILMGKFNVIVKKDNNLFSPIN